VEGGDGEGVDVCHRAFFVEKVPAGVQGYLDAAVVRGVGDGGTEDGSRVGNGTAGCDVEPCGGFDVIDADFVKRSGVVAREYHVSGGVIEFVASKVDERAVAAVANEFHTPFEGVRWLNVCFITPCRIGRV